MNRFQLQPHTRTENILVQECIPVGCIPPVAVAICWGCLPQCMLGYIPRPGPGPESLGEVMDTPQVWAWTPQVWAWTPARTPKLIPGSGPRHPSQTTQPPPGPRPRQSPPVNRIIDTRFGKYYLAPTLL